MMCLRGWTRESTYHCCFSKKREQMLMPLTHRWTSRGVFSIVCIFERTFFCSMSKVQLVCLWSCFPIFIEQWGIAPSRLHPLAIRVMSVCRESASALLKSDWRLDSTGLGWTGLDWNRSCPSGSSSPWESTKWFPSHLAFLFIFLCFASSIPLTYGRTKYHSCTL